MPDDLALAADLVRAAGELAARMLRDGLTVEHKTSISDVVSAADHAAEDLVVARLRADRPADGVVGEEGTSQAAAGRTWYVDPVDGTYNFLSGLPTWCAAIALSETGDGPAGQPPLLGAIYHPAADELWVGGVDRRTTCNGVPLPTLRDRPLAEVSLATYLHPTTLPDPARREPLLRLMGGAATVRMLGSGSVELAAVAAGRLGASVQANSLPWDWLPGAALVQAAGGRAEVIEAHGHRLAPRRLTTGRDGPRAPAAGLSRARSDPWDRVDVDEAGEVVRPAARWRRTLVRVASVRGDVGRTIGTARSPRGNPGVGTARRPSRRTPAAAFQAGQGAHGTDWLPTFPRQREDRSREHRRQEHRRWQPRG